MSTEYIQAVSIREGQVYLTSKSNNDDLPYHTWHCEGLSKVYKEEGQLGLDREILRMLCEYAVLKGSHPSIAKYREALEAPESEEIFKRLSGQATQRIACCPQRIKNTYIRPNLRRRKLTNARNESCRIRNIQRWLGYVKKARSKFTAQNSSVTSV